ncbi:hypothetical protein RHGRI_031279 [Rhododendron griersonianum]|uniref:Uncharacterized protein n=1 Tax=Rhododendron griersonianum TaxID=479676 RepID=A0AAV6I7D9_9ERIC|nr:hypothetical protein RHGRI_031279 [Rhododendron griersonianum]
MLHEQNHLKRPVLICLLDMLTVKPLKISIGIHDMVEIAKKIAEQSQPGVTNPQSEVQVSIDVLGKRSGYLKGYGIRKSTYATQSQVVPNSEIVALKEVVADQAKLLVDYAKKIETMMLFMATKNGV